MPGPRRSSTTRRRGALGARRGGGGKPRADRGGRGPVRYPHRRARRLPHPCRRPGQPPGGDAGDDGRGRDTGVGRHPPRAGRSGRHHRGRAPGRARPLTRAARQPPDAPPALLAPVPRTLRRFAPPPLLWLVRCLYDARDNNNSRHSNMADDCERRENGFQTARNPMVRTGRGGNGRTDAIFAYLGGLRLRGTDGHQHVRMHHPHREPPGGSPIRCRTGVGREPPGARFRDAGIRAGRRSLGG